MGEVYLGEVAGAANFTKQVAIKRILPHLAQDPDFVERFIDEANVMVQLHHGNIVPVLELSDEGGQLFIVMEYVPGRDLKNIIRALRNAGMTVPVDLAVWLVRQVLNGLDYAHRKNNENGEPMRIVHRDVSPGNIMIGAGGEVKLVDFGIARARGRLQNSVSGTLQGKFVYMSPEQAEGRRVGPASDIFSCGLVLYELICGKRPFEGESETDTLRRVRECKIVPPQHIDAEIPVELSDMVMKALDSDPDKRFRSAEEMAQHLRNFLTHHASDASEGRLSAFLSQLFPDGVIPQEDSTPSSLDDALNLQLDAFTPSVQSFEHTRTRTGPHAIHTWEHSNSSVNQAAYLSSPQHLIDSVPGSHITAQHPQSSTGRKRMLFIGLILGAMGAAAVLVLDKDHSGANGLESMVSLHVEVTPENASNLRLIVDDAPFSNGDAVNGAVPHVVCADAESYQRTCTRVRTDRGETSVQLVLKQQQANLSERTSLDIRIEPPGLKALKFTVDNAPFENGEQLDRGRTHVVCASALNHQERCERIRMNAEHETLKIVLRALPQLKPTVNPAGIQHSITVDGVDTRQWPMFLQPEREYVVCAQADGYLANPKCHRVTQTQGDARPHFDFTRAPLTGRPTQNRATSERHPGRTHMSRERAKNNGKRRGKAQHSLTLESIPTASVWLGSNQVGSTPYEAQLSGKKAVYTLKARGYADTQYTVTGQSQPGKHRVELQRPGYITLRVSRPPASEIWLDGQRVATGMIRRYAVTPGPHSLGVKYFKDGRLMAEYDFPVLQLEAGQDLRLPPLVLDIEEKAN